MMVGKNNIIFKKYPKECYYLYFNQNTGTLIRCEEKGKQEPFYAKSGPELLDVSITSICNNNCKICYRNSNPYGKHISFKDYLLILKEAKKTNVVQIALGGGNPNQHPDFINILKVTYENNIIPCYTTNGVGLTHEILKATKLYCGAMAVSYYKPIERVEKIILLTDKMNIKTNIHFILNRSNIDNAISLIESPPKYISKLNAIIFLNYKPVGRGSSKDEAAKYFDKINYFFHLIQKNNFPIKIGFDSCSISALVTKTKIKNYSLDFCEAGRFSAYINENLNVFPCSFLESCSKGINLNNNTLLNIWRKGEPFLNIRKKLSKNIKCDNCEKFSSCHGGCPYFDINFC